MLKQLNLYTILKLWNNVYYLHNTLFIVEYLYNIYKLINEICRNKQFTITINQCIINIVK